MLHNSGRNWSVRLFVLSYRFCDMLYVIGLGLYDEKDITVRSVT